MDGDKHRSLALHFLDSASCEADHLLASLLSADFLLL